MTNLVAQLRALAKFEHGDLTIGDDAANELERLYGVFRHLRKNHDPYVRVLAYQALREKQQDEPPVSPTHQHEPRCPALRGESCECDAKPLRQVQTDAGK